MTSGVTKATRGAVNQGDRNESGRNDLGTLARISRPPTTAAGRASRAADRLMRPSSFQSASVNRLSSTLVFIEQPCHPPWAPLLGACRRSKPLAFGGFLLRVTLISLRWLARFPIERTGNRGGTDVVCNPQFSATPWGP